SISRSRAVAVNVRMTFLSTRFSGGDRLPWRSIGLYSLYSEMISAGRAAVKLATLACYPGNTAMLLKPKYVARFRQVATVLIRHGFSDVLAALDLQRFLPGREPAYATPVERQQQRARSLREALDELGPTYIKLGQVLSTRPDILPGAYIEE